MTRPLRFRALTGLLVLVAAALVEGRGFSDPFGGGTGLTAWMPPGYSLLVGRRVFRRGHQDHDRRGRAADPGGARPRRRARPARRRPSQRATLAARGDQRRVSCPRRHDSRRISRRAKRGVACRALLHPPSLGRNRIPARSAPGGYRRAADRRHRRHPHPRRAVDGWRRVADCARLARSPGTPHPASCRHRTRRSRRRLQCLDRPQPPRPRPLGAVEIESLVRASPLHR